MKKSKLVVYAFSLYCTEHKRKNNNISTNKNETSNTKKLLGCNAHLNYCVDKHSVKENNDGILEYVYKLTSSDDNHSHPLFPNRAKFHINKTSTKEEIGNFDSKSSPRTVKNFINMKFNESLVDYHQVYYQLNKNTKKYRDSDAQILLETLEKNEFIFRYQIEDLNEEECRLKLVSFTNSKMRALYTKFNDVVFLDSTLNTNVYKMPLVLASVVDENGKNNIIFVSFLPDETKQSYEILFTHFIELFSIYPKTIVTDFDKAIVNIIDEKLKDSTHFLCHWHLKLNISKNLGWLNNKRSRIQSISNEEKKEFFRNFLILIDCDNFDKFEKATNSK